MASTSPWSYILWRARGIFPPSLVPELSTLTLHFGGCFLGCGGCCHSYVDHLIIQCMNAYTERQGLFQNQPCGKWYRRGRGREKDWRKTHWNKELQKGFLFICLFICLFVCFLQTKLLDATGFVPPCELPSPVLPSTSEELRWICIKAGASIGFEFLLGISTISSSWKIHSRVLLVLLLQSLLCAYISVWDFLTVLCIVGLWIPSHLVIPTVQELLCLLEGTLWKEKGTQSATGTCPAPLLHSGWLVSSDVKQHPSTSHLGQLFLKTP